VPVTVEPVTLSLGPSGRGAPDDLRPALLAAVAPGPGLAYVLTQQLSDRPVAEAILAWSATAGTDARVLVEGDYLSERARAPGADPWTPHGGNETARAAFAAFWRAAVPARMDYVGSLLHSNHVVRIGADARVAITSANLTPGSFDHHCNALVEIGDRGIAEALRDGFLDAWDGDFRGSDRTATAALADGGSCTVVSGAGGATLDAVAARIAAATTSIRLAMFTFADAGPAFAAIKDAIARGVAVSGVVDADQAAQPWDAVARLQALGADVRYLAGVLTGAPGRMHHKLLVLDGRTVATGTTNFSTAALGSHETMVFLDPPAGGPAPFAAYAGAELDRLGQAATVQAPPVVVPGAILRGP
jgi:hypothetical protein